MCWRHVRASRRKGGKRIPTSPGLQVVVRRRCEVGLFLHLRSCRPERTMEKRAYNTRRIISGVELASFHALSLFRLASLSLSHLLLYSTALTLFSKFHFLALSVFFDYYIYIPSYTYSCNKNMPSNRSLGQLEYMLHSVLRMFV